MPDGTINTGIGASVERVEDQRFLTGKGNYNDDINRPDQTYDYMLRSPHTHAKIIAIDSSNAQFSDGVVAIFTGEDIQVGGLPCGWQIHRRMALQCMNPLTHHLRKGRFVTWATRSLW